jgi:hypothetical protein
MIFLDKFYKPTELIGDNVIVYVEIITNKIPFPSSVIEIDPIIYTRFITLFLSTMVVFTSILIVSAGASSILSTRRFNAIMPILCL